jgi:hypothetical protein
MAAGQPASSHIARLQDVAVAGKQHNIIGKICVIHSIYLLIGEVTLLGDSSIKLAQVDHHLVCLPMVSFLQRKVKVVFTVSNAREIKWR